MTAPLPDVPGTTALAAKPRPIRRRLRRRHALMLALALEVLVVGAQAAQRQRPAGITVDVPSTRGHVIT